MVFGHRSTTTPIPAYISACPLANYAGWAVVGLISLSIYFAWDRRLPDLTACSSHTVTRRLLLGVGLYYGVLVFNLGVTFWIGEPLLGMTGTLMYVPVTALLLIRLGCFTSPAVDNVARQ